MSFTQTMSIVISTFIGTTAYDIHWVMSGRFGTNSYIPFIYPFVVFLLVVSIPVAKHHDFWEISPKKKQ
jgi:uncharacterized membrane protein